VAAGSQVLMLALNDRESAYGKREASMARQMPFEPLPASVRPYSWM